MNRWAGVAQRIESATRTSEKVHHLAAALQRADEVELEIAARLMGSRGMVESGTLGWGTIAKAVEEVAGAPAGSLAKLLDDGGDLGRAVEDLFESERPLAGPALEAVERSEQVRSEALAEATGTLPAAHASAAPKLRALPAAFQAITSSSGQRRHDLLVQLFYGCSPIAAKFLVRALVGDLRIGLRDGLLEAAIDGDRECGAPRVRGRAALAVPVEDKYDGIRAQLHVDGERAALFGRDLHDVTVAFPEIAAAALATGAHAILDGEIVAWSDGRPLPSSVLTSRLTGYAQTLAEQERTPVVFIAFDLLAQGGDPLLQQTYRDRRAALEAMQLEQVSGGQIRIATCVRADGVDEIESAFIHARQRGCDGLVVKAPDAPYAPGRRGSGWLKVKRSLDTLDVVIVGAEPGLGRRRALLSECTFAVRDDLSGRLTTIGRATVSLPDAEVALLSQWLELHTIAQLGSYRSVEPRMVAEVAFDAVRRSERTASGFTLRAPRITRLRSDLGPDQAATLASLESRCE